MSEVSKTAFRLYAKRFGKRWLRDATPWARDNILWGILMLVLPVLVLVAKSAHLHRNASVDWNTFRTSLWIYAAALFIYSLVHIVRTSWNLDKDRQENEDVARGQMAELVCEVRALETRVERALAEPDGPELMLEFQQAVSIDPGQLVARNLKGGVAYNIRVHEVEHADLVMAAREIPYITEGTCVAWLPEIKAPSFPGERFSFSSFLKGRPRHGRERSEITVNVSHRDANGKQFESRFEITVNHKTWELGVIMVSRKTLDS